MLSEQIVFHKNVITQCMIVKYHKYLFDDKNVNFEDKCRILCVIKFRDKNKNVLELRYKIMKTWLTLCETLIKLLQFFKFQ